MLKERAAAIPELEKMQSWRKLVIVPGYCHLRSGATNYTDPKNWILNKYQMADPINEIGYVTSMIRNSLVELMLDERTVVCFSGGFTSEEAGIGSSEAQSYLEVAKMMCIQEPALFEELDLSRIILDTSSYDSNNNLRGGITAFYDKFGYVPEKITFYVYALKEKRMKLVAEALGISKNRFEVKVVLGPDFNDADQEREDNILRDMQGDLLLEGEGSKHAQLSRRRNWSNAPVRLLAVDAVRRLFAE